MKTEREELTMNMMTTLAGRRRAGGARAGEQAGAALVVVIVSVALIVGLSAAALTLTSSAVDEVEHERRQLHALYMAESGISAGIGQLAVAHQTGAKVAAAVGDPTAPVHDQRGVYWTTINENPDGESFTMLSTGTAGRSTRTIEVVARILPPGPFEHAMFAGNFSDDPAYGLELGGSGGQADRIVGNIYSGGDVVLDGDSSVVGELTAGGTITGGSGRENQSMSVPMVLSIDYENFHDHDVATMFEGAPRVWDNAGGTAGQLPASSPGHIFRKNPSDRGSDVNSTVKDDYFLEDPYVKPTADKGQDGSKAYRVTLPESANNTLYFIDGNLWLHNRQTFSLKLANEGVDPTKVTFVVKGNVYFSDNLFYDDPAQGGAAFIALSDPDVEDSGNIYFGDPLFGTMQYAEGLLFAENNFIDKNLDAKGSAKVRVRGNMTAGNQVAIERDFKRKDGSIAHTKLDIEFDERQANGLLDLPGIPDELDHPVGYEVVTWREVPTPKDYTEPLVETIEVNVDVDPRVDEALPDKKWRKRWSEKYKGEWKQPKRKGKWSKGKGKGMGKQ